MAGVTVKSFSDLKTEVKKLRAEVEKLKAAIQPVEPVKRQVQVTAAPVGGDVQVSWTATEPGSVTSWLVGRDGTDTSGAGAWSATHPAGDRSRMFLKLVAGREYTFTVAATYSDGEVVKASVKAVAKDGAPTPTPTPEPQPTPKRGVTTKGTDLLIDGTRRRVAGFNLFGASGCHKGQPYPDADLDGYFQSLPARSITRTWGFRPQGLDNLRHVVTAARRNNQLLIVSLGDGVSHCGDLDGASNGQGSAKTTAWYQSAYKGGYRAWVDQVTREFATDDAIAGFEPMNEPIGQTGSVLRAFNDDIGGLIHANAPGKLVFSGQRGLYDFPDGVNGWKLAHASPGIDVCSLHEYDFEYQASRKIISGWWSPSLAAARELGKPIIVGEVGIGVPGTTGASQQSRAQAFAEKFSGYFEQGAAAVLVWNRYLGPSDEGYAVKDNNDPLIGVVKTASR